MVNAGCDDGSLGGMLSPVSDICYSGCLVYALIHQMWSFLREETTELASRPESGTLEFFHRVWLGLVCKFSILLVHIPFLVESWLFFWHLLSILTWYSIWVVTFYGPQLGLLEAQRKSREFTTLLLTRSQGASLAAFVLPPFRIFSCVIHIPTVPSV